MDPTTSNNEYSTYGTRRQLATVVDPEIKAKFVKLAQKQGSTASSLLRNLIYDYVQTH